MADGKGVSFSLKPIAKAKPALRNGNFTSSPDATDGGKASASTNPPTVIPSRHTEQPTSSSSSEEVGWLAPGLVVRILNADLSQGLYYGKMGVIKRVVQTYGAEVLMENKDIIQVDQDDCGTVIPRVGALALVVRGEYKNMRVMVESTERDVEVELVEGRRKGHRLLLPSSHICRHMALTTSD